MKTLRTIGEIRAHIAAARAAGRTVGLVPTMGAFHAGHEALMRAARERCDEVVVSLFVNPTQFNEAGDLAAYPRDEAGDLAVAERRGVDAVFAPGAAEIYPGGFATTVQVAGLGDVLEGVQRGPAHFAGVCTVVCKLFTIVAPDVAFFGQKDAQQVVVIRRMTRDLNLPVEIAVVPTVREADGLALSSRNARLGPEDRRRAVALSRGLAAAADALGEGDPRAAEAAGHAAMEALGVTPEYLAAVDPETLEPVHGAAGRVLLLVAARVGPARLIDNVLIDTEQVATRESRASTTAKEDPCPAHPATSSPTASPAVP
jgi:pantoate--beta-alanine ligase